MRDILSRFREAGHKGQACRATTFWSWNDGLDPEEIRRQIREMARGGLGGHFMHARRGRATPYLGSEWMEAVRVAIDEGRHTGVTPWLYDEDGWPSGSSSGRVYTGREAFRQKHLVCEDIQSADWEPSESTVAVFVAKLDTRGRYVSFRRLQEPRSACGKTPAIDEGFVHFAYRTGENVDVFNREATEEFLKQTYERYRETVGGEFGRAVPGIFTDEPQYAGTGRRVPWSPELAKFFRRACRYDLLDRLPELFFPVGHYRKTRFDFYQTVTRLFLLAWTMPIYQWCDRHGLKFTGHLMGEDTLLAQIRHIGAAMPHYEYMHIPGIDHLGRGLGSPVLVKQAASVAAQLGRPRVLGEMFGGSGWNVSLDDLRFIAEWQFVLGVNLVCTHLAAYTLRGVRKRDWPPSLHYHQPWWSHYYLWNDYVAAVVSALTAGAPRTDVLVVHPIASAWAEYSPLDTQPVETLDSRLRALVDFLLGIHADFHFGDELVLERAAHVTKGCVDVGACRYRAVVVPDATNLRMSTVRLLKRFRQSGGRIVFAGRVPNLVDGRPSDAVTTLARKCNRVNAASARGRAALRRLLAPRLQVLKAGGRDADSVLAQWRTDGQEHVFFFLNTDEAKTVPARLKLPVSGTPVVLDANSGECRLAKARLHGKSMTISHTFRPRESLLVAVVPPKTAADVPPPGNQTPKRRHVLAGRWNVKREDPNALVLDVASWRTDSGEYSDPSPVLDIQQELLRRGAQELIVLRFEFDCAIAELKGRRFDIVMEQPEACEMWYNGMRAPLADAGPYWDTAFRRIHVTPYVRPGPNVIEIKRPWHVDARCRALLTGRESGWEVRTVVPDVELEAVYLVGDFGVAFPTGSRRAARGSRWGRGRPRLVDEPKRVTGTDLIRIGYPFFAGRLTLEREVTLKREPEAGAVLELPRLNAITATVHVNGQEAGTVWRSPAPVPVDGLLVRGRNHVAVTLTTSLRNLLGPHHHEDGELYWVGPHSFTSGRGWPGRGAKRRGAAEAYNVVDFGLGGNVVLRY
ncbi:MAG TPA: glycosyl hydrolase [Phycisphaerae bacterium]|nr:glycosyl hydrolase [Phycisphaerae bacterium]